MATSTQLSFTKQSIRVPSIDYTSRDYQAVRDDMIRTIPFFTPEWTDHNSSDLGITLISLVAFVADVLHFYIDRTANEAFLPTAITRGSVVNLLKLIDFELTSAVPATADVEFAMATPLPGDLLIPAVTQLQTSSDLTGDPVYFETIYDLVIPAGQLTGTTAVEEGLSKTEVVGVSSGLPRQRFILTGTPIIDGTLEILIDEGVGQQLWTQVDSFIVSGGDDKSFVVKKDENDIVTVYFGDNAQGAIPAPGATIDARYRVGGGERGNVGSGTIVSINTVITYSGSPVLLTVTNPLQASGGEDAMSIDEAKVLGPRSLRALNRAVTDEDWVVLAEAFPGVAKAAVEIATTVAGVNMGCCCSINLVIAPKGGGLPSSELKADLLAYLEDRKMAGTCVQIVDPEYVPIDINGEVYVASNFATDKVALDVGAAIDAFFGFTSDYVAFGQSLYIGDLYHLIDGIPGVDHPDLTQVTCRAMPKKELWSGNGDFSFIQIGDEVKGEVWTVIFTSPTTFSVRGSVSGLQARSGTLGVEYVSDQGAVTFTITAGSAAQCPGDRATFVTCEKVANVPMGTGQIMQKGIVNLTFVGGARPAKAC